MIQEAELAEWLRNPVTRALVALCRDQQRPAVQRLLAGQQVDPVTQGQASAWHKLEHLLTKKEREVISKTLSDALKEEHKAK